MTEPDFSLYRTLLSAQDWRTTGSFLSPEKAQWLLHQGSLTKKLYETGAQLSVKVIFQGWVQKNDQKPTALSEKSVWRREVMLQGDGKNWIFARTDLPESTVRQVAGEVLYLGERPIGLWLFPQNPTRVSLQWRQDPTSGLYARRSDLLLKGYPIEIKELFLTDFIFQ
ncbi:chorismate--pyruvate lyase family protein [Caviibacterium pharyngocola]|uniref:Chorismate lyase n=1 Tax=Caviibacterium pharyngocola TaxID=28159 RepID=A0A2M8RVH1_9PAST|nr:chorismate lyase [Caviibacterium pharyngocola]PJG82875.1 chorismate lyase [Caviibacterium pharyngocola]